jgi:starch-binding outer membrane protein, SusD/RagB family
MKGKIFIALALIFTISSCSEFLTVEPDNQISIAEQFSTKEGVLQAVNGMYFEFEALYSSKLFIYAGLLGGNISFSPIEHSKYLEIPIAQSISQIYEFRDLADDSDMEGIYRSAYDLVNAANLVIEYTTENEALIAEEIQQVTAEALACRAYVHYILAILYAQNYSYTPDASHPGIIYNTSTITSGVDFPVRLSMAETYLLMKNDLETAMEMFTENQALPYGKDNTYFNPMTTASLFARVALQMNDWESAYRYADTVISYAGLSLMKDSMYISEWEDPTASLSETIFELSTPKESDGNPRSSVAHDHYRYNDVNNYNEYIASGDLLDQYAANDIRKEMFLEVLLPTSVNGIITDQVYYFTRKFQAEKAIPVTRLSEMYLIRAEAAARKSTQDNTMALISLNAVRYRAGLDPLFSDENILEEIFLERRRELAFENFLFFDLARYHKDIERDKGCLASVCSMTYPADHFVLPIPEKTVLLNENLQQNDGY